MVKEEAVMKYPACRLALGRAAITCLRKIYRYCDVSISINVRIVQAMVFPETLCESESWTLEKDRKLFSDLMLEKIPENTLGHQEN